MLGTSNFQKRNFVINKTNYYMKMEDMYLDVIYRYQVLIFLET